MSSFDYRKLSAPSLLTGQCSGFYSRGKGKAIAAETVEAMAREGLTRTEMAKRVGLSYSGLNRRITESYSLSHAEKRGKDALLETLECVILNDSVSSVAHSFIDNRKEISL